MIIMKMSIEIMSSTAEVSEKTGRLEKCEKNCDMGRKKDETGERRRQKRENENNKFVMFCISLGEAAYVIATKSLPHDKLTRRAKLSQLLSPPESCSSLF